jgi:enoyl-CoA hydratase/carnithine racemase
MAAVSFDVPDDSIAVVMLNRPEVLMEAALAMARSIAANNAYGVWQTKTGLNAALDAPSLRHAKEIENRTQVLSGFTNNPHEAAMAHREKRAPRWDPL